MDMTPKQFIKEMLSALDFEEAFGLSMAEEMRTEFASAIDGITDQQAMHAITHGCHVMVQECLKMSISNLAQRIAGLN